MYQELEQQQEGVLAVRFTGKMEKADYDQLIPVFEEKIRQYGKVSVYLELELLEGWSPLALAQEIKFDIKHARDLKRVALVGDQDWLSWVVSAAKAFSSGDIRHFPTADRTAAWNWVAGGPEVDLDRHLKG